MYVREGLTCDSSSYQDLNGSNRNIELQFLELNFPHSKNILLVNVYRPPDGNDVYIIKKKSRDKRKKVNFSGRSYRTYSYEQLLELIATKNLEPFMTENDPEKCWSMLYKLIIELADKLCPVRNYRVKSNKPQWLTREVLEAQKDRDYFYSKAMSTGDEGDWFIARQMRNIANKMTRSAKAEFV